MARGRHVRVAVAAAVLVLGPALAACADDDAGPARGAGAPGTQVGGQITWLVEQPWGGVYNVYRPEGSTYYLREVLAGTVPVAGDFSPAGGWTWSTDLFSSEPTLLETSPQTMEFPIAQDAVWSDGTAIDVDDFRFAWFHNSGREDQCTGCNPADVTGWELVDRIDSSDDGKTVRITLRDGATDAEWFAHFWPSQYPAHVAEAQGFDWHTPPGMGEASQYFAATAPTWSGGPYVIERAIPDERVTLVPNERWYGAVRPTLDRIVLEVIPNPGDWVLALQNGELDGGAPLAFDPDVIAQLQADDDVETTIGSGGGTFDHIELNARSAALADVELRRAILTAIDTEQLRARTFGDDVAPALRTNTFFEASSPHHEDLIGPTRFGSGDLDAARGILEAAGYTGARPGQSLAKDGTEVPALRFPHGPAKATLVEVVQAELSEIGISVTPEPTVPQEYLSLLSGGSFDLAAFSLGGGPLFVGAPGQLLRSGSPVNFTGLDDPEIDARIDQIPGLVDLDEVADVVNDIAARALGHATVMTLWDNPSFAFVRHGYVNVRDNRYSSYRALLGVGGWALAAD
jgi:peptide/nickel transport system substrate-binding protein